MLDLDDITAAWEHRHGKCKSVGRMALLEKVTGEPVIVSTVLLGCALSIAGPHIWSYETRIFGGRHDQDHWHYGSRLEAEAGHADATALARGDA